MCSGGSLACSVVSVVVGCCGGLLPSFGVPWWRSGLFQSMSVFPRVGQGVVTLVSLAVGQVEGGLSARPSHFWWSRPVLCFIFSLVARSALDEASGENFPGYGVGVNIAGVFGRRGPPWRRCVGMFPALVCVFRVETFLRFFGGAMTAASAPFPSWGRRFGSHGPLSLVVLYRRGVGRLVGVLEA
jgi:hypothetical protein